MALTACAAHADSSGSNNVSIGSVYLSPRSSSGPSTVVQVGAMPVYLPQAGTGVKVQGAGTVLLAYEHYWTDQVSTQFALGIPPTHKFEGTGSVAVFGVLGEGQQLSPTLLAKYNFGEPGQTVRPYVGLGFNYTWFRKTHITNAAFQAASYGPNAVTSVSASTSWNPVLSAGLSYRLDEHWSLFASLSYAPLTTKVTVNAANTYLGVPVTAMTEVKMHTLATAVNLAYRF
jgi:outer membrane protein